MNENKWVHVRLSQSEKLEVITSLHDLYDNSDSSDTEFKIEFYEVVTNILKNDLIPNELTWLTDFKDTLLDVLDDKLRQCSECGNLMNEGYCIDAGAAYACSDKCLYTDITPEEWEEMYDDGNGDSYWTQWD